MAGASRAPARSASAPLAVDPSCVPLDENRALSRAAGLLRGRIVRSALPRLCLAAALLCASTAEAARAKKKKSAPKKARPPAVCMTEYRRGLKLEEGDQLLRARRAMALCSRSLCGAELSRKCKMHREQLAEEIPSVIPGLTDDKGAPLTEVEVTMDGEPLAPELDGRAIEIDPGVHEFAFSTAKGVIAKRKVAISSGQHNRAITVTVEPPKPPEVSQAEPPPPPVRPAPPPPPEPVAAPVRLRPAPTTEDPPYARRRAPREPLADDGPGAGPYLLGAIGLIGVGGYGLLTYWARGDNDALDQCSPFCPTTDIDHIRKMYLAADVSLGVGVVALVASTWLFASGSSSAEERAMAPAARKRPVVVDVKPGPAGAVATVSGAF
jgi:hypothetical protein